MTSGTSSVHDTPAQASEVQMIEPNNVGYKAMYFILLGFKTLQISAINTCMDELRKTETILTFLCVVPRGTLDKNKTNF